MNKQLQDCAMSTRDESKSTFRLSIITFNWSMIEQLNRLTLRHYLKVFNGAFLILFFLLLQRKQCLPCLFFLYNL